MTLTTRWTTHAGFTSQTKWDICRRADGSLLGQTCRSAACLLSHSAVQRLTRLLCPCLLQRKPLFKHVFSHVVFSIRRERFAWTQKTKLQDIIPPNKGKSNRCSLGDYQTSSGCRSTQACIHGSEMSRRCESRSALH